MRLTSQWQLLPPKSKLDDKNNLQVSRLVLAQFASLWSAVTKRDTASQQQQRAAEKRKHVVSHSNRR